MTWRNLYHIIMMAFGLWLGWYFGLYERADAHFWPLWMWAAL